MADKKEVFDYLRNKQKAAEIEAKVHGINLWVLLGAISIVTWQLLESVGNNLWSRPDLISRALLFAAALFMLSSLGGGNHSTRRDVRYSQFKFAELESPFLILFQGALFLFPVVFLLNFIGIGSASAVIIGFFGVMFVSFGIAAIFARLFNIETKTEKFPKPDFGQTVRTAVLTDLFFGIAFSLVLFEQGRFAWTHQEIFTVDIAKQLALLTALYLLLTATVERKLRSNSIAWTYDLETELLLGSISTEVAVRRIEHRGLGPRLQDVMDRFFDDMDSRINKLDFLFKQCEENLEAVKTVPSEYATERASRIKEATLELSGHIENLTKDSSEFSDYLIKLEEKNIGERKAILAPHIANLRARHKTYMERLQCAKVAFKKLVP